MFVFSDSGDNGVAHAMVYGTCQPENVFLTNSRYGEVDWEDVRLGDFGSSVEVALGGRTTLDGLHTRCGTYGVAIDFG